MRLTVDDYKKPYAEALEITGDAQAATLLLVAFELSQIDTETGGIESALSNVASAIEALGEDIRTAALDHAGIHDAG